MYECLHILKITLSIITFCLNTKFYSTKELRKITAGVVSLKMFALFYVYVLDMLLLFGV